MKEAAIPLLIAAAISLLAINAKAEEVPPDAMVDAVNGVFGVHEGARAVHAKGTVLTGTFAASPEAAALSKVLSAKESSTEQIKASMKTLREARAKQQAELQQARQNLREVLSIKQEARLVLAGLLD